MKDFWHFLKLLSLVVLFILIAISKSFSQIPSWPPGGTYPSPLSSQYNLPGGRYLPSTKRYNLVWADQIVPQWETPGKIEFAAKNYVATQKIWSSQAAEFRQYNPNFLIVAYHLAEGLNPERNDDCPDPKSKSGDGFIGVVAPKGYVSEWTEYFLPWLEQKGILQTSLRYEYMFQHYDEIGFDYRVWHNDPYWLMNMTNTDWQNYLGDICIDWMAGNENEGCFLDVAVETNSSLYNPKSSNPSPRNFNWWQNPHAPEGQPPMDLNSFYVWQNNIYLDYFREIYKRFHSGPDYLVLPNVDQMITTIYDPVWLDGDESGETIDGAMIEGFGNATGRDMWHTLDRSIRHITGRGKILIAQFYNGDQKERYRRTGMYMLIKNENSYINILDGGIGWYPEYEIDLGDQSPAPTIIEELRASGSGWESLWKRDYQNGIVLCNTSTQSISYSLVGDDWNMIKTIGGDTLNYEGYPPDYSVYMQPVSGSVNIPASDCIILKKTNKSSITSNKDLNEIIVWYNSNTGELNIDHHEPIYSHLIVEIFDVFGRIVFSESTESKGQISLKIASHNLSSGIYYVKLNSGSKAYIKKIIIDK